MIEYVLIGIVILVFIAGLRAGRKNIKGEAVNYPGYFNLLNASFWDLNTAHQKNIFINKIIMVIFTIMGTTIHVFFFIFVIMYLLIDINFLER